MLRRVQSRVIEATAGLQKPAMFIDLDQEFYLVEAPVELPDAVPAEPSERGSFGQVMLPDEGGRVEATYDESHALLIAVSDYQFDQDWPDLPGTARDIDRLADVLTERHGFEVKKLLNPTGAELDGALKDLIRFHGPKENTRILIYFAGHGATTVNGQSKIGWLVPADAPSPEFAPEVFAVTALSMRRVEEYSEILKAKHVLWVFDSCFSGAIFNMIGRAGASANDYWQQHLLSKRVRRVITSGSEGETVPDDSIFARLLVEGLNGERPVGNGDGLLTGQEIGEFLKQNVINYSRATQTPQNGTVRIVGLDEGDIVFRLEEIPIANSTAP